MVIFVSDKVDINTSILNHKEIHYKIIKEEIHQEGIIILYVCIHSNRASRLRMGNLKTDPHVYDTLNFDKGVEVIEWGEDSIFKNHVVVCFCFFFSTRDPRTIGYLSGKKKL